MESLVNIHTHNLKDDGSRSIISISPSQIANIEAQKSYSLGLHPWFIKPQLLNAELDLIRDKAQSKNIRAIGEAGLDKLCKTPFDLQKKAFIRQIEISEELKKPMIIHCVKAHNELIQLKKQYNPRSKWIIHGFNSKLQLAKQLIDHNLNLAFGKALLKDKSNASAAITSIPENQFFLETDDENISIIEIYQAATMLKKISFTALKNNQIENFKNAFRDDQL